MCLMNRIWIWRLFDFESKHVQNDESIELQMFVFINSSMPLNCLTYQLYQNVCVQTDSTFFLPPIQVLSVAISADSETIVSGSWDGSIRLWRVSDGRQVGWFTSNIEILQVKLSNNQQCLIALGERDGNRKLITLQVIRNRIRTTTTTRAMNSSQLPSPERSPLMW